MCFGCSTHNAASLGLRFYYDPEHDEAVSFFSASSAHSSFPGVVHGGIISVLADEVAYWALQLQVRLTISLHCHHAPATTPRPTPHAPPALHSHANLRRSGQPSPRGWTCDTSDRLVWGAPWRFAPKPSPPRPSRYWAANLTHNSISLTGLSLLAKGQATVEVRVLDEKQQVCAQATVTYALVAQAAMKAVLGPAVEAYSRWAQETTPQ